jgi:hypothetical protein
MNPERLALLFLEKFEKSEKAPIRQGNHEVHRQ